MKKILLSIATMFLLLAMPVFAEELPEVTNHEKVTIHMFRGNGCPACKSALTSLVNLGDKYDDYIEIKTYEVWYNSNNAKLLNDLMQEYEIDENDQGIPFFVVGKSYWVGYNESEIFTEALKLYEDKKYTDYIAQKVKGGNYSLTSMTLTEAATEDGIFEEENTSEKEEEQASGKYDTYIIIGIFVVVIGGFIALIVASNKKN